ncbi:MAG: helix-turn-helix transcriptional regulator [Cyanobacteria bacterium J06554_3]
MAKEIPVTSSCGNVFADLGLADPDELLLKAKLAAQISNIISQRALTPMEAATLLTIDQPKVSALVRGKLSGFSVERLFRFLNTLGSDIEIRIIPNQQPDQQAQTRVVSV